MITLVLVSSLYRMKKTVFKKHGPPVPPSNQTAEHCLRYSLGIKKNLFYFFNEQIFYPLRTVIYNVQRYFEMYSYAQSTVI